MYLEGQATSGAPDGLLEAALQEIDATNQRPGWLVPDRWFTPHTTVRLGMGLRVGVRVAFVVLLIGMAVAALVIAGSQRRLPPPGLAKPGLIVFTLSGDIYEANPDGTSRRQLTAGLRALRPTWSPDGTRFAFEAASGSYSSLIVMSADGRQETRIADRLVDPLDFVWSPDGRRVAVGAATPTDPQSRILVAEADGSATTELGGPALSGASEPAWSPDGRELAYQSLRFGGLWVVNADGTDNRALGSTPGSGLAFWNTQWSPDGSKLAYLAGDDGAHDVWVINADGTNARNITQSPEDEAWPAWSPDGTKIAFPRMSSLVNEGTFVLVEPDGSHPIPLVGITVNSNVAIWSPDGKRLFGYHWNAALQRNDALAFFDASGHEAPVAVSAADLGEATWQRLAP